MNFRRNKLVIKVRDNEGTYFFCGFSKDKKQIILSKTKNSSKLYEKYDKQLKKDIINIIHHLKGNLILRIQLYDLTPDFE